MQELMNLQRCKNKSGTATLVPKNWTKVNRIESEWLSIFGFRVWNLLFSRSYELRPEPLHTAIRTEHWQARLDAIEESFLLQSLGLQPSQWCKAWSNMAEMATANFFFGGRERMEKDFWTSKVTTDRLIEKNDVEININGILNLLKRSNKMVMACRSTHWNSEWCNLKCPHNIL